MNFNLIKKLSSCGLALGVIALMSCSDYAEEYKDKHEAVYGDGNYQEPSEDDGSYGDIPMYPYSCGDGKECAVLWQGYDGNGVHSESTEGHRWTVMDGYKPTFKALDKNGRDYTIDMIPDDITPLVAKAGGIYGGSDKGIGLYIQVDNVNFANQDVVSGIDLIIGGSSKVVEVSLMNTETGSEYMASVSVSPSVGVVSIGLEKFKFVSGESDYQTFLKSVNAIGIKTPVGKSGLLNMAGIAFYYDGSKYLPENNTGSNPTPSVKSSSSTAKSSSSVKSSSSTAKSSSSVKSSSSTAKSSSSVASSSSVVEHETWLWQGGSNGFDGNESMKLTWSLSRADIRVPADLIDTNDTDPLVDACKGVCGKAPGSLSDRVLSLADSKRSAHDLSKWNGMCFAYYSTSAIQVIGVSNGQGYQIALLEASAELSIQNELFAEGYPVDAIEEIYFVFESEAGSNDFFNIQAVGSYGDCQGLTLPEPTLTEDMFLASKDLLNSSVKYGTMTDERDGHVYGTVDIGGITWMAENLNYSDTAKTPILKDRNLCAKDSLGKDNCRLRGRLYKWVALADTSTIDGSCGDETFSCVLPRQHQGVCPDGWHLPNLGEFRSLIAAVDNDPSKVVQLMSNAPVWSGIEATNATGFSAVSTSLNEVAQLASSSILPNGPDGKVGQPYSFVIQNNPETKTYEYLLSQLPKESVYSVRCVKDYESEVALDTIRVEDVCYALELENIGTYVDTASYTKLAECPFSKMGAEDFLSKTVTYESFVDERDNHEYKAVEIGPYTWMAQNLDYRDSVATLSLKNRTVCGTIPVYPYDGNCDIMGTEYTWSAAIDSVALSGTTCGYGVEGCELPMQHQGVCPAGWHLPNQKESSYLVDSIGQGLKAATLMSKAGVWETEHASNTTGFSAIPSGGIFAEFWTAKEYSYAENGWQNAYLISVYGSNASVSSSVPSDSKNSKHAIRCVKNYEVTLDTTISGHSCVITTSYDGSVVESVTKTAEECGAKGFYWSAADGSIGINTGVAASETQRFYFSDDSEHGGLSTVATSTGDFSDNLLEQCNSVNFSYELRKGALDYNPFVGLSFNVANENSADVSEWGGLCVSYVADDGVLIEMRLGDEVDASIGYDNPFRSVPMSASVATKEYTWSQFSQAGWGAGKITGTAAAAKLVAIRFKIQSADGTKGSFKLLEIGSYGRCTGKVEPTTCAEPVVPSLPEPAEIKGDLWVGSEAKSTGNYSVNTGFSEGYFIPGAWWWWDNFSEPDGGVATTSWKGDNTDPQSVIEVIDECEGICGTVTFGDATGRVDGLSIVGFGFNVAGPLTEGGGEVESVDISDWEGLCFVYESDLPIGVKMNFSQDRIDSYGWDLPSVTLKPTIIRTMKNFRWSDFKQGGWGTGAKITGEEGATDLTSIRFEMSGTSRTQTERSFKIHSIGKYGSCE